MPRASPRAGRFAVPCRPEVGQNVACPRGCDILSDPGVPEAGGSCTPAPSIHNGNFFTWSAAAPRGTCRIDPSFVITHRLPLDEAPSGYRMFRDKQDEYLKVVLMT